jgi:hypothetical protein
LSRELAATKGVTKSHSFKELGYDTTESSLLGDRMQIETEVMNVKRLMYRNTHIQLFKEVTFYSSICGD